MDKFKTKYVHEKISELFLKSLNKKVFTGSSLAYSYLKRNEFRRTIHHYGKVGFQNRSLAVDNDTFFDLASLTKPLVTTLSLLVLLTEEIIRPEDTLSTLFTFSLPADKKDITLKQLMTHSSGLPPHKPYFQFLLDYHIQQRKDKILQWILQEKLEYKPGKKHLYSDLDFILLGFIIEEKTGQKIDKFWFDKILLPLGLENYFCFEEKKIITKRKFASTGRCSWSDKELSGIVHDDNCRALGGIAGHAGLFGRIEGVISLCEIIFMLYNNQLTHPFLDRNWLQTILKKQENSTWTMGFDTPSQPLSSSGNYFSDKSVGHLGFTGTSLWIDLAQKVIIVLLTNRVISGMEKTEIQLFRPQVHNIIMEDLVEIG